MTGASSRIRRPRRRRDGGRFWAGAIGPKPNAPAPAVLLPDLERLDDVLEAVLDGILQRGALRLVADLEDRLARLVLGDELHPHAGIRRPAAPDAGAAARLPGIEDIPLDPQVATVLHDLPAELLGPLDPLLEILGARLGRVLAARVLVRGAPCLQRDPLERLEVDAFGEVDPVGLLPLRQLVVALDRKCTRL